MAEEQKDMYFITMENIADYMEKEDRKLDDEELIQRVKLNFRLFKENKVPEKKKMLLNNCLITFRQFEKEIPPYLIVCVYYELIKLQLEDLAEARRLLDEFYVKFHSFPIEEKNKANYMIMEIANIISMLAMVGKQPEIFKDAYGILVDVHDETEKKPDTDYIYANAVAQMGALYMNVGSDHGAMRCYLEAVKVLKSLPDDYEGKFDNLPFMESIAGQFLIEFHQIKEAKEYLLSAIKTCTEHDSESKMETLHLSYNCLARIYISEKDYEKALDTMFEFLSKTKDIFSGEQYDAICADFYFRIGTVYGNFMKKKDTALKYMKQAKGLLNGIKKKDYKTSQVEEKVDEYLKENV